jgi:hypothetical protein
MKLENPKDVFLYLSKYLHCYNTSSNQDIKSYFICLILGKLLFNDKISNNLYNETRYKLNSYLFSYAKQFGGYYTPVGDPIFLYYEIKQRKAFLKFIYKIELKHEQNNSN